MDQTLRSDPKTLMELAAVRQEPADLDHCAVVIIDAQKEYTEGALPLVGIDGAIEAAASLLGWARRRGVPLVHVVHRSATGGGLFDPEGTFVDFIPSLCSGVDEMVVVKTMPNAFTGTLLHEYLKQIGRDHLILCGFMTHNCVGATARAAVDLGYRVSIVADCTATRDLRGPFGGRIAAEEVQTVALAELADRFATIIATSASLA